VQPEPYDASSGIAWTRTIATGADFTPSVGLRATTLEGNRAVQVQARLGDASGAPLAASVDVPFAVTHWSTVMLSLRNSFVASDMTPLVQALDDAQAQWQAGEHSDAIRRVVGISGWFDSEWRDGGGYTSEVAIDVGRLLRGMQREWYAQLMTCVTPPNLLAVPTRTAQDWRPVDPEAPTFVGAYDTSPAWLFGYVSSTAPRYSSAWMEVASGVESEWQAIVYQNGEADVGILEGGEITRYLPGSPFDIDYRPFVFGNQVEFQIQAFPSIGLAGVQATITSINGQAVTLPMLSVDSTTPVASFSVRVPPGSSSLGLVGKITATYLSFGGGPVPVPPVNEMLRIRTTTSNVCRRPGA
jgi:hypothetical protein